MAEDLRRFLDDRPIAARRNGPIEQAWRWCRRNPTGAALVVTAMALLILAIGGGAWQLRQAADRRAEAEHESQEIRTALGQVEGLRQQGRIREARAVIERLEGRAPRSSADVSDKYAPTWRWPIDWSRSSWSVRTSVAGDFDLQGVSDDYDQAFRKAGLALNGTDQQRLAVQIGESAIKDQLVAALDDWAFVAFNLKDEDLRCRLLGLARAVDPDPSWRDRFRDPEAWRNRQTLEGLAMEAPVASLSPPILIVLGSLLELEGADAEAILRAAQQSRPSHFWINWELGTLLMNKKKAGEAVGFFRAALVMRPESGAVYKKLARALQLRARRTIRLGPSKSLGTRPPGRNPVRGRVAMIVHAQSLLAENVPIKKLALKIAMGILRRRDVSVTSCRGRVSWTRRCSSGNSASYR